MPTPGFVIITHKRAIQAGKLPDCAHSSAAHRLLRSTLIGLTAMGLAASAAEIRMVVVTNDLVIAKDTTLNVRLIVRASQVTIDGQGSMLHGPGAAENLASPEQAGVGILV